MKKNILSTIIIILGLLGFFGVSQISYLHFTKQESCPMIGQVPACYVIFVGYFLIVLSMLLKVSNKKMIFLIGWIPVFMLALIGSIGELTDTLQCPHTKTGIPKCYFSAIYSAIIGFFALYVFKNSKK